MMSRIHNSRRDAVALGARIRRHLLRPYHSDRDDVGAMDARKQQPRDDGYRETGRACVDMSSRKQRGSAAPAVRIRAESAPSKIQGPRVQLDEHGALVTRLPPERTEPRNRSLSAEEADAKPTDFTMCGAFASFRRTAVPVY